MLPFERLLIDTNLQHTTTAGTSFILYTHTRKRQELQSYYGLYGYSQIGVPVCVFLINSLLLCCTASYFIKLYYIILPYIIFYYVILGTLNDKQQSIQPAHQVSQCEHQLALNIACDN